MPKRRLARLVAVVIAAVITVRPLAAAEDGAAAGPLPLAAREARQAMERELDAAERAHVQRLLAAREKYLAELRKAQKQALNAQRVEDTVALDKAVRDEAREVEKLRERLAGRNPERDPAVVEFSGKSFELADLADGAKGFSNRRYQIVRLHKSLAGGWRFTRVAGGKPPEIKVNVKEAGLVYAASVRPTGRLEADGWKPVDDVTFGYNDEKQAVVYVFAKPFDKGEEFALPQCNSFTGSMLLVPPGK